MKRKKKYKNLKKNLKKKCGTSRDLTRKPSISDGKLKRRTKNFTEFLANNPIDNNFPKNNS